MLPLAECIVLPCGSPSPPLLHEVKLSGPGSGGGVVVRLRQEGKLALLHMRLSWSQIMEPVSQLPDLYSLS